MAATGDTLALDRRSGRAIPNTNGLLAGHYGFTAEELDFTLNYDIKYRLGRDIESEE